MASNIAHENGFKTPQDKEDSTENLLSQANNITKENGVVTPRSNQHSNASSRKGSTENLISLTDDSDVVKTPLNTDFHAASSARVHSTAGSTTSKPEGETIQQNGRDPLASPMTGRSSGIIKDNFLFLLQKKSF